MGKAGSGNRRPDESIASDIASEFWGRRPEQLRRFAMGIGHWVYEVCGLDGEKLVVRVGSPDQAEDFAGATHWSGILRPMGFLDFMSELGQRFNRDTPTVTVEEVERLEVLLEAELSES